jgi:hypothetical protein
MNKLYICGITQNKLDKIKQIVEVSKKYVDGYVWTDHFSIDGTYEYLESNKKDGQIYQFNYTKDHDLSANIWLRSGHIKDGDWCFILDSTDIPNENFLKQLRENIYYWNKNGVDLVYGDRPWLFKWNSYCFFQSTPHWGLHGYFSKIINLSQINGWSKESYLFNTRDTLQSAFTHPARYWFEFGRSNHNVLLYAQFGDQVYQRHEELRVRFRSYCKEVLKIDLTLEALIDYMKDNIGKYPEYFEQILETEIAVKDIFRLKVLNQDWIKLHENRHNWSYFHWKNIREIEQDPQKTGFIGVFNQYKIQKGEKPE